MKDAQIEVAKKVRIIRKEKQITINELAISTGLTASFISQFERGLTAASISTLQKIAQELEITLSVLFEEVDSSKYHIKTDTVVTTDLIREKVTYDFAIDHILANIAPNTEVIYSEIDVDGGLKEPYHHRNDQKIIFVIEGTLQVYVDGEKYILEEKESITFSGEKPHSWSNIGDKKLKLIWVLS